MNFKDAYKKGQEGSNKGLPMGKGLEAVSSAVNEIQRAMIYGVAASPKGGKSTFVDAGFVIAPLIYVIDNNTKFNSYIESGMNPEDIKRDFQMSYIDCEIIYLSYEIDRISKEFDFCCHFLNHDFGIEHIQLDAGVTYNGKSTIDLSSLYLRGQLLDDNKKLIKVKESIYNALITVYENRIVPLFGEYSSEGKLLSKGYITFIENKENPTGIRNYLIAHAKLHGEIIYTEFIGSDKKKHKKMVGYNAHNPDKYVMIVTDHLRKLTSERGYTLKQTVDKFSEYAVEIKNLFKYTFVHIIHLNRSMTEVARMKQQGDMIYPNSDDIKETGNLAEDCDFLFTLFNPNAVSYTHLTAADE